MKRLTLLFFLFLLSFQTFSETQPLGGVLIEKESGRRIHLECAYAQGDDPCLLGNGVFTWRNGETFHYTGIDIFRSNLWKAAYYNCESCGVNHFLFSRYLLYRALDFIFITDNRGKVREVSKAIFVELQGSFKYLKEHYYFRGN